MALQPAVGKQFLVALGERAMAIAGVALACDRVQFALEPRHA